ncbi:MAM and LDL-receptor class A domain-containing protein 1 [Eumeta japonica]|uniref:MAM and LDL-receptor class A domain-containing protein 1 n=1 Tax=Eumeta variegata TaxID=151549 RepID=A0A4C1UJR2_EUMVA|nr:MAM and LDL-receptor class A domain-containing protein 1 [Eumeta japonica]
MFADATSPPQLSCDFESPALCGWAQDELHDFDWRRLNRKTPSSFLFTGPSYDHTYGEGGLGYYMYIESTSQRQNDTARLLSPIYDASIAKDGCFTFYYHMFGRATGGLRVYQKPESYPLQSLLELEAPDIKKYLLFEKWGNQGNAWYGAVSKLTYFGDNFQIVIEGIRGSSFTSDIAVDDVAIQQGANCSSFDDTTSGTETDDRLASARGYGVKRRMNFFILFVRPITFSILIPILLFMPIYLTLDSERGTAFDSELVMGLSGLRFCSLNLAALYVTGLDGTEYGYGRCELASCAGRCDSEDLVEACGCSTVCVINADCCADYADMCLFPTNSTTAQMPPKTEKLIGSVSTAIQNVATSTTPSPSAAGTRVTTATGSTATTKSTTLSRTTRPTTGSTRPQASTKLTSTTRKPAVSNVTNSITTRKSTQKPSTLPMYSVTAAKGTKSTTASRIVTSSPASSSTPTSSPRTDTGAARKPQQNMRKDDRDAENAGSSNNVTIIVIFTLLVVFASGAVVMFARSARGRIVVERIRGRYSTDPEVRFLTRHEDDD